MQSSTEGNEWDAEDRGQRRNDANGSRPVDSPRSQTRRPTPKEANGPNDEEYDRNEGLDDPQNDVVQGEIEANQPEYGPDGKKGASGVHNCRTSHGSSNEPGQPRWKHPGTDHSPQRRPGHGQTDLEDTAGGDGSYNEWYQEEDENEQPKEVGGRRRSVTAAVRR